MVDAVPSTVVTPGVSPSYPSGSSRIITSPGSTDSSTELSPASPDPTAKSRLSSPPGNGALRSGTTGPQGASYQTRGQDSAADRAGEPTAVCERPSPRPSPPPGRQLSRPPGEPDPLDNIPPFDLPGDVPRSSSTPPAPPAAEPAPTAGSNPKTAAARPNPKNETPVAEADELELASITVPAPEPAGSSSVGPGLAHFVAVDLKLAGGSLPSAAALDWLAEKGYRTLLDLRESAEVSPSFIAKSPGAECDTSPCRSGPRRSIANTSVRFRVRSRCRRSPPSLFLRHRRHPLGRSFGISAASPPTALTSSSPAARHKSSDSPTKNTGPQ